MGNLCVVAMTSADAYYEGPAGAGDMLPLGVDDGFNAYNAEAVERAAHVVVGHKSFKDFSHYWPLRESAEDASDAEKRFARRYNPLPKTVVSRRAESVDVPTEWASTVRVVSDDVAEEVSRLKEQADDKDVVIWGSRDLWTQLLQAGLVDELHLIAGTGVAGGGTPVFPADVEVGLVPLETRLLVNSQCVLTRYSVQAEALSRLS